MSLLLGLILVNPAHAWENTNATCTAGRSITGSFHVWYIVDPYDDWNSTFEDAAEEAADQWTCGTGERNRGCDWEFIRSGYRSAVDHTNSYSEVGLATYHHLTVVDLAGDDVLMLTTSDMIVTSGYCSTQSFDIEVRDTTTDSETWIWGTWLPSVWNEEDDGIKSFPAALVHEFGHGLGLTHSTDPLSVMERRMAAEIGGQLRIHEDDYVGLTSLKPGTSTGKNFMLGKWASTDAGNRTQRERWRDANGGGIAYDPWEVTAGGDLVVNTYADESSGPGAIEIIVNGTASSYTNVPVYWTISDDTTCFDGDDVVIGTLTTTLSSNAPYEHGPSTGLYSIPSGTPTGLYYVCAGIDPYGTLSETDTTDNVIISERQIEVIP
ncbi:MAG: matrixin family metalloprotease [Myxococcota bacterium]